jgi:hypothetical protein
MNYYEKYIKYKTKYLELRGGKIPIYNTGITPFTSENKPLPINVFPTIDDDNINFNPRTFEYDNTYVLNNDLLNSIYDFCEKDIIINEKNIIPFHTVFLQNTFNIIVNLRKMFIKSDLPTEQITQIDEIFNKYFTFDSIDGRFITIKAFSNDLTKYMFINKFLDYLRIIYKVVDISSTIEEHELKIIIEDDILLLYGNDQQKITNLYDMFSVYNKYFTKGNATNTIRNKKIKDAIINNTDLHTDFREIINEEIDNVIKLKNFIIIVDSNVELNNFFNIKPSLLFFGFYIGKRIEMPALTIGNISSNIFKISINDMLLNLFDGDISIPALKSASESTSALEPTSTSDKLKLFKKIYDSGKLLKIYPYSSSIFKDSIGQDHSYADCVENGLLHFLRLLIYSVDKQQYDINLINNFTKMKPELRILLGKINKQNENSSEIKNEFSLIVSNIGILTIEDKKLLYKQNIGENQFYEIKSSIENFNAILGYLLGIKIKKLSEKVNFLDTGIKSIKIDDMKYTISYNGIKTKIEILVKSGHTTVGILPAIKDWNQYEFIDLVLLLSDKYYIHEKIKFNMSKYLLPHYNRTKDIIPLQRLPIHLKFMLLNDGLYFCSDEFGGSDINDIIYLYPQLLQYIQMFSDDEKINFILKSKMLYTLYNKLSIDISTHNSLQSNNQNKLSLFGTFFKQNKHLIIKNKWFNLIKYDYTRIDDGDIDLWALLIPTNNTYNIEHFVKNYIDAFSDLRSYKTTILDILLK